MLNRIAWTEPARQRGSEEADFEADPDVDGQIIADTKVKEVVKEVPIPGSSDSLEDNMCWLVWEGQLRDRSFSNFKVKTCPTDSAAKEVLGQKLACYWDQAKNWKPEEEFF
jgi:U4/U6 small nuclear ribonucleoprotein PRP3